MDTYALKQQQSLLKRLTNVLLLAILVAAMSLAMTATPSYAIAYYPSSWAKTYGGTESEDAFCVQQTSDGGFIVGGSTSSFGVSKDYWIIKLNSDGKIQWQRAYGGDGYDYLMSMQQTTDGGYIAAGATESPGFGAGMRDFWVLKLDDDGDIQWQNAYGGSHIDGPASAIQQTSDGGYITGGFTYSFGEGGDLLVLKLDELGSIEWQKNYGGTGAERRVENIRQTSDGGFILTSATTSFTPGSSVWVLKLEDDGDIQWQKVYRDGDAEDIQLTNDGGYILLAEKNEDFWVLKLEDDGDIQWQKTYGGTGLDDAQPIRQTSDGGYIMGGSTTSFGVSGEDFWIVKLDSDGNIQWERTYGGDMDDEAISLGQTSGGGYIAAGGTESFGTEGKDFWVLRLHEDGGIGCCLGSYLGTSNATVTDTTVTPFDTAVTAADSDATMTPTTAIVTDTSATLRKQCFFKVIPPGAVAQCLTSGIGLRVHNRLVLGLFLVAAVGLIFLIAAVARRRKDQNRESP